MKKRIDLRFRIDDLGRLAISGNSRRSKIINQVPKKNSRGFTIVELMVVIALIGLLAVILNAALNPDEIFKKARDSVRLNDLTTLRKAIELSLSDGNTFDGRCSSTSPCDSKSGTRATNGTGYININLAKFVSTLPLDPSNVKASMSDGKGQSVSPIYQFATDGTDFEIRSRLEAKINTLSTEGEDRYATDGGCNNAWYEVGTNLCLMN